MRSSLSMFEFRQDVRGSQIFHSVSHKFPATKRTTSVAQYFRMWQVSRRSTRAVHTNPTSLPISINF